jgi:hypothetical protein
MKTAAAIIVVLALVSILHKEKHKEQPPPVFGPVVTQPAAPGNQPGNEQATQTTHIPTAPSSDQTRQNKIIAFAKLNKKSILSDDTLSRVADAIVRYSDIYNVDYAVTAALCYRESRFNPNAVSPHGAKGLFQMIDSTARNMGVTDTFDIDQNAAGGIRYIKQMMDRWNGKSDQVDRALASFLLGPRVVENCDCVPASTQPYLKDIYAYRDTILSIPPGP